MDLAPLIDRAAESPSQFAVDIPHTVAASASGEWTKTARVSMWTYSVQIPGAVSMSFHATDAFLPPSATLTVTADGTDYVYGSEDVRGGAFWSRIGRGDSLVFVLSVATEDVGRVRLEIASFQAGYRSLGDGVSNHSRYDALRKHALATTLATASCGVNWSCQATATNAGPGKATAALVISNSHLCTGVLLNDVPGDGTPYLLTARHCQTGDPNGGTPSAAGNIVVYWNAVAACGSPLGTVYDSGSTAQFGGADTVVEQQDAWLVRLRSAPVADVYYAGWDATGGAFVGGFSPHHASGTSRQFVGWYGQAVYFTVPPATFGLNYSSTFWGTVNAIGTGGPGSSGGGLFDDSGHLVGTVVRGLVADDDTGVCPATPPPAPTEANATALSTALSGIFTSTADAGSSTNSATLQSVLDPGRTGALVLDGRQPVIVTLQAAVTNTETSTLVGLTWNSFAATSCTASGGEAGDGWTGSVATSGTRSVTSFDGGDITYTVSCTDGHRTGTASVTVHWSLGAPRASMSLYLTAPVYGVPFDLYWNSNVRPCIATGGSSGDGWGGSLGALGQTSITENVVGIVTYTLTCGTGSRIAKKDFLTVIDPPLASIVADTSVMHVGQPVGIGTTERGAPCIRTGGAAGDGWSAPGGAPGINTAVTEFVAGTYTYKVACGSGAHVASAEVSISFTLDPAAVSIQSNSTTGVIGLDTIDVTWSSNTSPCHATITDPTGHLSTVGLAFRGSYPFQGDTVGRYTFDVACGSGTDTAHASIAMDWTNSPAVRLRAPARALHGESFDVTYISNVVPCTLSGGAAGDSWTGQFNDRFETITVAEQSAGTYTYTVTCGSGNQMATNHLSVEIAAAPPHLALTADAETQFVGKPITLSWTSNAPQCSLSGGGGHDGWTGTVGGSGSLTVTEPTPVAYSFGVTCVADSLVTSATAIVVFGDVPAPTLTASKTEIRSGETVTVTWASADGSTCSAQNDGSSLINWYGPLAANGSSAIQVFFDGDLRLFLTCGTSLRSSVHVKVNPLAPTAPTLSLTATPSLLTLGDSTTLTYTVSNANSCTASGGSPGDQWTGSVATQGGSVLVRPTTNGLFNYTITCERGGNAASASAPVTVAPSAPSSGGGGGGGGGSIGPVDLAFLLSLGAVGYWRRRQWQP